RMRRGRGWSFRRRRFAPTMAPWSPGPGRSGWRSGTATVSTARRGRAGRSTAPTWGLAMQPAHVAIIGERAWGTALAQAAAMAGRTVTLVGRNRAVIEEINQRSTNSAHLGDTRLSERITAVDHFADNADLVILAVPAQSSRAAIVAVGPAHLAG